MADGTTTKKTWWWVAGIILLLVIAGACTYFFVIVPRKILKRFNALTDQQKSSFIAWANTKYNCGITNEDLATMNSKTKKVVVQYFNEFLTKATAIANALAMSGL